MNKPPNGVRTCFHRKTAEGPFSDHLRLERRDQEVQQLVPVFAPEQTYGIRETGRNALLPSGSCTIPGFSNVSELAHLTL
jgi:hypothetical protein